MQSNIQSRLAVCLYDSATFVMGDSSEIGAESFPNVQDDLLQCLTPWPTGEEAIGGFYRDIFGPTPGHPSRPSPTSTDPLLLLLFDLRSTLGHIAALRHSGAFAAPTAHALSVIDRSMCKFVDLYESYSAYLIQNWWRAIKPGATDDQKERLRRIRWGHPGRARSADEEGQRRSLITEILEPQVDVDGE
jgi:hypothetical protein